MGGGGLEFCQTGKGGRKRGGEGEGREEGKKRRGERREKRGGGGEGREEGKERDERF